MFDPILSIAAMAFIAAPVILYFFMLRPSRHSNKRGRGERSAFHR